MLTRLSIRGLAIIDSLSIEFSPGFNVITGETGAGKSILIRALNYLCGARATADSVRKGASQAVVTGEFSVPEGHPALNFLDFLGIPVEKDLHGFGVLIRRHLSSRGRSQCWINDVSVTTQPVRQLGGLLLDVFAQHENQRLMDAASHVGYLDDFVQVAEARDGLSNSYEACSTQLERLRTWLEQFYHSERNQDFLAYRLQELKQFDPTLTDYEEVSVLCKQADYSLKLREALGGALRALEEEANPAQQFEIASNHLKKLTPDQIAHVPAVPLLVERLSQISQELEDIVFELRQALSKYDVDEGGLDRAQDRLFGYQSLFRKHGVGDIEALVAERARLEEELGAIEKAAEILEDRLADLERGAKTLGESCQRLTQARKQAATRIKKNVQQELRELAMPGAQFGVDWLSISRTLPELDFSAFAPQLAERWERVASELVQMGPNGQEKASFLFSANPGEALLPLAKIASGGEISRIMLALKKALTADADTCVLVFDEIDTGISGRVADVVGRKMLELSQGFQVIGISHLAQVAAHAQTHFRVEKSAHKQRTQTQIVKLSEKESATEIARLLSGGKVSKPSLANAQALIAQAKKKKGRRRSALSKST